MNIPYLNLQVGNTENIKGRAILSIEKQRNPSCFLNQLIDINGPQLKEDLQEKIVRGKLISPDIFIPEYLNVRKIHRNLNIEDLRRFADEESRDLIIVYLEDTKNSIAESTSEQMVTRYLMRYYEDVYMRILENMAHDIFRYYSRYPYSEYYVALFRVARLICFMLRAVKEHDSYAVEYYQEEIQKYQEQLPILDLAYLVTNLCSNPKEGQKIINGIDALYLTLKKHFICPYNEEIFFSVDKDSVEWLNKNIASLYYRFFYNLLHENYEQAMILREEIKNYDSQSIKGYH